MAAQKPSRPKARSGKEAKPSRAQPSGAKTSRTKSSAKNRKKSAPRKSKANSLRTLGLTALGTLLLGIFSILLLAFFLVFPPNGPDEFASPAAKMRPDKPAVRTLPPSSPEPAPEPERSTETEPSTELARTAVPDPMENAQPVWIGQASSDAMPVELFVPPHGFGGTPWGQPLSNLSDMELQPSVGPFEQRRPMGETSFEDEPLQDVLLMLYDNKLAGVTLWLDSREAYDRVVTRLVGRYGPPRPGEAMTWDWPDIGMAAAFMPTEKQGVVSISYKPLARQAAEAQEAPPE